MSTFQISSEEEQLALTAFQSILDCEGRPFGGNGKITGISDGNDGVQWNCVIDRELNKIRLGVNLEGVKYKNRWPIADFIESELLQSVLLNYPKNTSDNHLITIAMFRDAWQVASRPKIQERYIGGKDMTLNELTPGHWMSVLKEAHECLRSTEDIAGRANYCREKQKVTLIKKDGTKEAKIMGVSPHLYISTELWRHDPSGALKSKIIMAEKISLLLPVYEAVSLQIELKDS